MSFFLLLIFILIDMCFLLLAYKYFGKSGLIAIYILHIIFSQMTINIPITIFSYTTVVGSSLYAVLFLTMDMVNEHYGKKSANEVVNIGVYILIIFMLILYFIKILIIKNADDISILFNKLFENQWRIVISDILVSYYIFQKLNILIFDEVRKITKEKYLWLRNNLSTMVSQVLTAIFFYQFAFFGIIPQNKLWQIILAGLIIKLVITLFETPFLYLSCKIKPKNEV
jgi:uncharacterized integral membrane protein (TIGR00697 family)